MRHKSNELKILMCVSLATLLVAFLSMSSLSSFKLGLGFGKDMRIITEIQDQDKLIEYIKTMNRQAYDIDFVVSNNDVVIMDVSGVESTEQFVSDLSMKIPSAKVLLVGTFGSVTKFLNNHSFITMCMLTFMILIALYGIMENRLFGFAMSLEMILNLMLSLLVVTTAGYAFSTAVWYTMIALFALKFILDTYFLEDAKVRYAFSLSLILMGLFMWISNLLLFQSSALYVMAFGAIQVVLNLILHHFTLPLFKEYREGLVGQRRLFFRLEDDAEGSKLKVVGVLVSVAMMILLLSILRTQQDRPIHQNEGSKVLVVNRSDSANYLEIQALFHKLKLFNLQKDYQVSEQGQTWIEFDSKVSQEHLEIAQKELTNNLGIFSIAYESVSQRNIFNTQIYNVLLFASVVLSLGIYYLKFKMTQGSETIVELSLAVFIYIASVTFLKLDSNQSWLLTLLYLPFMYSLIKTSLRGGVGFMISVVRSAVMLILIAVPIFVIVPSLISVELIYVKLILFIALYSALLVSMLLQHIRKGAPYDIFKS